MLCKIVFCDIPLKKQTFRTWHKVRFEVFVLYTSDILRIENILRAERHIIIKLDKLTNISFNALN